MILFKGVKVVKKLFGNLNMSWKNVIMFAVAVGIYTGIIMQIDFLDDTSFQDIGILYEFWVLFAVIIVVNCGKNTQAMLKCFAFFLISQPIIFLVEVIGGAITWEKALLYLRYWTPLILMTLPGGFIAHYCKKQNLFGAIILGLGNTIQAVMGSYYTRLLIEKFPHHLLSVIFCFGSILVMSYYLQKENKYRLVAISTAIILTTIINLFYL